MSHFTVMVIGDSALDESALEPLLQPYHEYECTGCDDQYVVEVDITDEITETFNRAVSVVVLADGKVVDRYDDALYVVEECGRKKTYTLPEGAVEKEMPADEARTHGLGYASMDQCAEDYYGIRPEQCRDGRYFNKTNPNRKWDWWQLGGRWSGMLRLKGEVSEAMRHIEALQARGLPIPDSTKKLVEGVNRGQRSWTNAAEANEVGYVDAALKGQIDFEALRGEAEKSATEKHTKANEIIAGRDFETWGQVRTRIEALTDGDAMLVAEKSRIDVARDVFHAQQVIMDLKKSDMLPWFNVDEALDTYRKPLADVVKAARASILQTFAVLKDGEWIQKGEMGWFGCSTDEMTEAEWSEKFAQLLDDLPDTAGIAIVDCHI
jgi:hypothetical protein